MLTPMLVQYLVGLCCLRHDPNAVDVTIGDMVLDVAAAKSRDVDVTVTIKESDGSVTAFKAYEVKREGKPLDVSALDQLCMKLNDMPSVTHRGIVSASGFTPSAISKAAAHKIDLFQMLPWEKPLAEQFPEFIGVGTPDQFMAEAMSALLFWIDASVSLVAPKAPGVFIFEDSSKIFDCDGKEHDRYSSFEIFRKAIMLRSTETLCSLEPAKSVLRTFPLESIKSEPEIEAGPAWPHTHTIDVGSANIYLDISGRLIQVTEATISGRLQWRLKRVKREFYLLERVLDGSVFAAAALTEFGTSDGKMFAMVFAPGSRKVNYHTIQLQPKHKNMIRRLNIPRPGSD